jgi:hypothetical protein
VIIVGDVAAELQVEPAADLSRTLDDGATLLVEGLLIVETDLTRHGAPLRSVQVGTTNARIAAGVFVP